MLRAVSYPPELADYVIAHWPRATPLAYPREVLVEVLSACFQASMTVEEGRPTRFRLLLTPPSRLPEDGGPKQGALRLVFDARRPLTSEELRRLSPSAPFETSLIGAHAEGSRLEIWGLAHSGPSWLAPAYGGRSPVPVWTVDPIVHVTGPGRLAVRSAGRLIGALERGALVDTTTDVFEASWLGALLARAHDEAIDEVTRDVPPEVGRPMIDRSLVRTVSQHMLRRVIQLVRAARHGGLILVIDRDGGEPTHALSLKYRFAPGEPRRRYRTLLIRLIERLVAISPRGCLSWADYEADQDPELLRIEGEVFELSRLIAGLCATDGAVVLDHDFELIGYGAEVSAKLAAPTEVLRAVDVEGYHLRREPVESVGTRHRAAYRFVHDHPRGLAIVISHDGAVRFVAARGDEVVYWEQSVSP
jgi:hypothetical protein